MGPTLTLQRFKRAHLQNPAAAFNHLMFAILAFFMIQQQLVDLRPAMTSGPWVAQALHYQPRTPPPVFEPDQIYTEEALLEQYTSHSHGAGAPGG